jgi:hypothetical protein
MRPQRVKGGATGAACLPWPRIVAAVGLVESGKIPKPLTWLLNYSRKYSLWMFQWGLAVLLEERIQREGLDNDNLTKRWRGEPIISS